MKQEELRNKYIREICDKNSSTLRRLAETNSDDSNYLAELANEIEREVDAMLNEDKVVIGFKRLSDDAIIPTKAHPSDSGYDLYAAKDVIIEPGDTAVVKTGIAAELPPGYEAQVRPRSGVTAKTKLRVQLGTIDNGYTGEIGVLVDNIAIPEMQLSTEYTDYTYVVKNKEWALLTIDGDYGRGENIYPETTYLIRKGDRIAQLVIQRLPETVAVEIDELSEDK